MITFWQLAKEKFFRVVDYQGIGKKYQVWPGQGSEYFHRDLGKTH